LLYDNINNVQTSWMVALMPSIGGISERKVRTLFDNLSIFINVMVVGNAHRLDCKI